MFPFLIRQLADTSGISRLRRDWEAGQPVADDEFDVQLTAYDSITQHYSWTEQTYSATGGFIDKPGGRSGTALTFPAKTFNGEVITGLPKYARIRKRIPVASYAMVYEIINPTISGSLYGIVTKSTTQTLTASTNNIITWEEHSASGDPNGLFNPASPTKLTITQTGFYIIGFNGFVTTTGSNALTATFLTNGTDSIRYGQQQIIMASAGIAYFHLVGAMYFAPSSAIDIEVQIFALSSGATLEGFSQQWPFFWLAKQ